MVHYPLNMQILHLYKSNDAHDRIYIKEFNLPEQPFPFSWQTLPRQLKNDRNMIGLRSVNTNSTF